MVKNTSIWLTEDTKKTLRQLLKIRDRETYDQLLQRLIFEHMSKTLTLDVVFFKVHYIDGQYPETADHRIIFQLFGGPLDGLKARYFDWERGEVKELDSLPKFEMSVVA